MLTTYLAEEKPDSLLELARKAAGDPRPGKLDLTIGVYRNDAGHTPVMQAVKHAEARLRETQTTKAYLGVGGNTTFVASIFDLLGVSDPAADNWVGVQTPGGTGALRLAAELLAKDAPGRTLKLPQPSWANHLHVLRAGGLSVESFQAYDATRNCADLDAMLDAVRASRPGDVLLVQPICQNPTGADLAPSDLALLADTMATHGVIPLLDVAYHGFAEGIEDERAIMQIFYDRLPELLVSYSCSKNFGLYRERVGALLIKARDHVARNLVNGVVLGLARANYSMPPDHGAAVVAEILADAELRAVWRAELAGMTARLNEVRQALSGLGRVAEVDFGMLRTARGMFCQVPLSPVVIRTLRDDHAIYIAQTGRINLAALQRAKIDVLAKAVEAATLGVAA